MQLEIDLAPVSARDRTFAYLAGLLLIVLTAMALPFSNAPWPAFPFMQLFSGAQLFALAITAYVLFAQFTVRARISTGILAATFVIWFGLDVANYLTLPGFISDRLFVPPAVSSWMYMLRHVIVPLMFLPAAAWARSSRDLLSETRSNLRPLLLFLGGSVGFLAVFVAAVIAAQPILPTIIVGTDFSPAVSSGVVPLILLFDVLALATLIYVLPTPSTTRLWICVVVLGMLLDLGISVESGQRYTVGWYAGWFNLIASSSAVLILFLSDLVRLYRRLYSLAGEMTKLAYRDPLTGIANRRSFDQVLENECGRARRERLPISLLILDVDHFKAYNDAYGHPEGDHCLKEIAGRLADRAMRYGDFCSRIGGEEFALILPSTPREGARAVAEQLRSAIGRLKIPHPDSPAGTWVSVSIGVASLIPDQTGDAADILSAADQALYHAKHLGRNCVSTA